MALENSLTDHQLLISKPAPKSREEVALLASRGAVLALTGTLLACTPHYPSREDQSQDALWNEVHLHTQKHSRRKDNILNQIPSSGEELKGNSCVDISQRKINEVLPIPEITKDEEIRELPGSQFVLESKSNFTDPKKMWSNLQQIDIPSANPVMPECWKPIHSSSLRGEYAAEIIKLSDQRDQENRKRDKGDFLGFKYCVVAESDEGELSNSACQNILKLRFGPGSGGRYE